VVKNRTGLVGLLMVAILDFKCLYFSYLKTYECKNSKSKLNTSNYITGTYFDPIAAILNLSDLGAAPKNWPLPLL